MTVAQIAVSKLRAQSLRIGATAVLVLGALTGAPALAQADTTVHFDDQLDGTYITDQYANVESAGHGVRFGLDGAPANVRAHLASPGDAQITALGTARSAPNVLRTSYACHEFCATGVAGYFGTDERSFVSVYPGVISSSRTTTVTLTAYDSDGQVLGTASQDVDSTPPPTCTSALDPVCRNYIPPCNFSCELRVDAPHIKWFTLTEPAESAPPRSGIDDLSFGSPSTVTPSYRIVWTGQVNGSSDARPRVPITQGGAATTTIHLDRTGTSPGQGTVSYDVSGLPPGVHASFAPSGSGEDQTLSLTADAGAPPGDYNLTVTGTASDPAMGQSPQRTTVPITVSRVCAEQQRFGIVDARTAFPGFCQTVGTSLWRSPPGQPVSLNGLTISPTGGTSVELDSATREVSTVGGDGQADVTLTSAGILRGALRLPRQHLDWHTPASGEMALPDFAVPGVSLGGFSLAGSAPARLGDGAFAATAHVELPNILTTRPGAGAITGDITIGATNDGGIRLDGLNIKVPEAFLGALELHDVSLSYQRDHSVWEGQATAVFPAGTLRIAPTPQLPSGGIGFRDGSFSHAGAQFDWNPPGVPIFTGVNLTRIGFSIATHPTVFRGTVGLSLGYGFASIDGQLLMIFASPDQPVHLVPFAGSPLSSVQSTLIQVGGTLYLNFLGRQVRLATADVTYIAPAYFAFSGNLHYDLPLDIPVSLDAYLNGAANVKTRAFDIEGGASVCAAGKVCAGGNFVLSSVGVGGCVSTFLADIGGWYRWGGGGSFMWHACDTAPYVRATVTARASSAARSVRVDHAMRGLVLQLQGSTGPPRVRVTGPRGESVIQPARGTVNNHRYLIFTADKNKSTYLIIGHPSRGVWKVTPLAGTPSIKGLLHGEILPKPSVRAKVTGKGARRVIRYTILPLPGQHIEFAENDGAGFQILGRTSRRRGTLRFTPIAGTVTRRKLVAIVLSGDVVRKVMTVAAFRTAPPAKPKAPARLRLTRTAGGLRLSWISANRASRYAISVELSDGRKLSFVVSRPTLSVAGVARTVKARVTVVTLDAANTPGAPATTIG